MLLLGGSGFSIWHFGIVAETRLTSKVNTAVLSAMPDWEYPGELKRADYSRNNNVIVNSIDDPEVVLFGDFSC